jgi:hypothetical protein
MLGRWARCASRTTQAPVCRNYRDLRGGGTLKWMKSILIRNLLLRDRKRDL